MAEMSCVPSSLFYYCLPRPLLAYCSGFPKQPGSLSPHPIKLIQGTTKTLSTHHPCKSETFYRDRTDSLKTHQWLFSGHRLEAQLWPGRLQLLVPADISSQPAPPTHSALRSPRCWFHNVPVISTHLFLLFSSWNDLPSLFTASLLSSPPRIWWLLSFQNTTDM